MPARRPSTKRRTSINMGHRLRNRKSLTSTSPERRDGDGGGATKKLKARRDDDSEEKAAIVSAPVADETAESAAAHNEVNSSSSDDEADAITMSPVQTALQANLALLQNNTAWVDVAETVFRLIKQLVQRNKEEHLMEHVIKADGISLTCSILKENPSWKGVQKEGRALLSLLCRTVEEQTNETGIQAVQQVMKMLPNDVAMQTKCCKTLWIASSNGFRPFIWQAGGIPLLLAALRLNEPAVQFCGLGALMNLSYSCHANRQKLVNMGGLSLVIDILKQQHNASSNNKKPATVRHGITILGNLASRPEHVKAILQAAGHVAIVQSMNQHEQDVGIQDYGCWALEHLTRQNGQQKGGVLLLDHEQVLEAGVIPAVIKAMKTHPDTLPVQKQACRTLYNLSRGGNEQVQQAIVESKGLEVLGDLIRLHSSDSGDENKQDFVPWAEETIQNCS